MGLENFYNKNHKTENIDNTEDVFKKELTKNEKEDIERVVHDLEAPIQNILTQLKPRINKSEYKIVLGEDASGRLPAIAFYKVLSSIYRQKGFSPLSTRFISGSGNYRRSEDIFQAKKRHLKKYIYDLKKVLCGNDETETGRILVVTDYIHTGKSLTPLVELLNEAGIDFDIAAIGVTLQGDNLKKAEEKWGTHVTYGSEETPLVYNRADLSGIVKDNPRVHARRLGDRDKDEHFVVLEEGVSWKNFFDEHTQVRINNSRGEIDKLAKKLTTHYFQK